MSLRLCPKKTVNRTGSLRSPFMSFGIDGTARPPPAHAQPKNYAAAWLRQTGGSVFLPRSIGCKSRQLEPPPAPSNAFAFHLFFWFLAILYRTRFTLSFCANIAQSPSSWFHQRKTLSKAHKKLRFLHSPRGTKRTPSPARTNLL